MAEKNAVSIDGLPAVELTAMRFEKWQALGNDYVIVEAADLRHALTPGSCGRCATATPASAPTACSCSRRRTSRGSSRGCGSSTPTARRPSSAATARARRSCTCATGAGPTATSSRSRPSRGRSARRSCRRRPAAWTWAARVDFRGARRGRGGGRAFRFQHVSIGNPQCAIGVADARGARRARPRRDRPRDRACRAVPEPDERLVVRRARAGRRPRADLRARGGGDDRLGHRRERRRRRLRPARRRLAGHGPARRRRPRGRRRARTSTST